MQYTRAGSHGRGHPALSHLTNKAQTRRLVKTPRSPEKHRSGQAPVQHRTAGSHGRLTLSTPVGSLLTASRPPLPRGLHSVSATARIVAQNTPTRAMMTAGA